MDRVVRAAIGPRRVGGTYHSHRLDVTYRVDQLVVDGQFWAVTVTHLDGPTSGAVRTHRTPWHPRDQVLTQPDTPVRLVEDHR